MEAEAQNAKEMSAPKTLEAWRALVKAEKCRCCGNSLKGLPIDYYQHDNGWPVVGFAYFQWLSIRCRGCDYEWSLWKIGVPRPGDKV